MFRINRFVVYPIYGVGKVVDKYEPADSEGEYYKIEFVDSSLTISVPVKTAQKMGLRYPLSKAKMKDALKGLTKSGGFKRSKMKDSTETANALLATGLTVDAVIVVKFLRDVQAKVKEDGKTLGSREGRLLRDAHNFLASEVTQVLGEVAAEEVSLDPASL